MKIRIILDINETADWLRKQALQPNESLDYICDRIKADVGEDFMDNVYLTALDGIAKEAWDE